jgi:hypothetical protein
MRAQEFITELWTQPYELTSRATGPANMEYYFDTKDNRSGRIVFDSFLDTDDGGLHVVLVIVHFYIDNLYHTSGKGDAVAIFSTVVAACRDYLRRYKPPVVTFETDDAKKRNLYVRMTGMFPDYVIYPYPQWVQDPIVGDEIVDSLMDGNAKDAVVLHRRDYDPEKTRVYIDEQGVAEGSLSEIYKMPPTKDSSQGMAIWAYNDALEKKSPILYNDNNVIVFKANEDLLRYIILQNGDPVLYIGLSKFLDGYKSGTVATEIAGRGKGLAQQAYLNASDILGVPIYSDTTQTDASRLGIWDKLIQQYPNRIVGYDQKTNKDLPLSMSDKGPIVNQNQPIYVNKKDTNKSIAPNQRYRTRILKLLPKKQSVAEDAMRGVIYTKPNLEHEWPEANRYPEFHKLGKDQWIKIARQGSMAKWSSLKDVGNFDSDLSNLEPEKRKRAAVLVNRGKVELPIVGRWSNGELDLIAGNTRTATLLDQGHDPKVWVVDVPDVDIKENFADGKKPGRKGLAKRSGVNTKASVSSLRKTAKNSSGEKQRMAHWLANMKAGRAKKK